MIVPKEALIIGTLMIALLKDFYLSFDSSGTSSDGI
jgi:hypothetical protein